MDFFFFFSDTFVFFFSNNFDAIFMDINSIKNHGRIIKWTQHISFLTLAGNARVVEGNDSKRKVSRILRLLQFGEI